MRQIVSGVLVSGWVLGLTGCVGNVAPSAPSLRSPGVLARAASVAGALRDLYPVTVGVRWSYVLRQSHQGQALPERTMEMGILRAEARPGGVVEAVLERRYRNFQLPPTRVLVRPESVVLSRLADPIDGPSLTILRGLPAAGAAWSGRPLKPGNEERVVVIGEEDVEVPAGRWRAWRVDHELRYADGDGDTLSYWYAAGVGCVRMIERTTIQVGAERRKLEVDGLLTSRVAGAWPPEPPPSPQALEGLSEAADRGLRLLPLER